ncbi:hypothetical protein SLEP1_g53452 [Rubroshorea leprosula]|uniref:NB-ARC domain-containing protein n=1 Tax=Rubroshorea leprosula TaxID=152421 RepID=A0AAV5M9K0_9ROSI|nr:hypothetical protein SLEP1_g53452 [Rubroshorea leprosula]
MDAIGPITGIVKDVVPTVKKYVKYQICHNDYANEFKEMQTQLKHRRQDIEKGLHAQLMQPGKIAKEEVEAWLEKAEQETAKNMVEDLICKGDCFTYICSSRKLDKRTQSLTEGIFNQGERYTSAGDSLVVDTPSIEYWATPGKIASMEVKDWLNKVGQQIPIKVEDLINQGGCSSLSNLRRKIEELKQIFEQGEKYTNAGESLVTDVYLSERDATVFKEMQEQLKLRQKDIKAKLETSLQQPRKMASNEVKDWMEKASQQIDIKVEDLISQGECSSPSNLWKKIEELRQILEQGKEFTNASVILVIDDHSKKGVPLLVEECRGRDDIQVQILEWLKGDEVTRIAVSGMGGAGKTTIMKQVHNQLLKEPKFNEKRIASSFEPQLELRDDDNETKNAGLVSQKLRQGNSVVILDDVWQQFCLEDVGIPILDGNNGCKLVLTTRLQDVARAMECEVISVNPLPPEEALALFLEEELIECWIEEGFIYKEGETRDTMNCEGLLLLEKLVDNCLLGFVKDKYKKDCVSMHDLFREMALDIRPQFLVKAGIALEKVPEEHEWGEDLLKISLMRNNITEIPSSMSSPKCPMLTTLLLSNNKISTIPEAFFEHMLGLKILDLSWNRELSRLPSSVSKLEKR